MLIMGENSIIGLTVTKDVELTKNESKIVQSGKFFLEMV